jgi:hypothetical protein
LTKAADEESHLRTLLGANYEGYCARTGRWFPRWLGRKPAAAPVSAVDPERPKPAHQPSK